MAGVVIGGALSVGSGEPWWVFEEGLERPVGLGSWGLTVERGYRIVGGQWGSGLCDWGPERAPALGGGLGRAVLWV